MHSPETARWIRAVWIALGILLLARLVTMAWIPLMDTTEGRYGEIGRKMVATGDWITPWHDHGVPFWGKPPLSFWLTAVSFKLLGVNEFAARLPHLLCSVATVACVWNAARPQGAAVATTAAALMGASLLFFLGGAAVMTDAAMVLGVTMALSSTWLAMAGDDAAQRGRHRWLAFIGAAIGVLAKGPLTLVLIGAPLVVWVLWCGRWRTMWAAMPWVRGIALMMVIVLPWFVWAERKTPGFIEYFIVGEHFHRFVTPGWDGDLYGNAHHRPKGMIWAYAAGALAPWTALVPLLWLWRRFKGLGRGGADVSSARHGPWALRAVEQQRLALLWGLMPLLFFTASSNIIWTYVLPSIPGLAWWVAGWMGRAPVQGLRWALGGTVASVLALSVGTVVGERVGRYERGSAQGMVAVCRAHAFGLQVKDPDPLVVVLGRRSFSADYYAAGRALRVDDLATIAPQWADAGRCVALLEEDRPAVAVAGLVMEQDLGRHHGRRVLWVVKPPAGKGAP